MNILVTPNALKGSLSAIEAAEAMCSGIRLALPNANIQTIPIADGGDGLIEVLATTLHAEQKMYTVTGPLGNPVQATLLYLSDRRLAIIEMAQASGLMLLKDQTPDVMVATSTGTGQLIKAALNLGCRHIIVGLGGSATVDGGTGLATALGIQFEDKRGNVLEGNGVNLQKIDSINIGNRDIRLDNIRLEAIYDVGNPLLGAEGAARIYAPQKGASTGQARQLEQGLTHLADRLERVAGKGIRHLAGAGAAGGMGAGLAALFNTTLVPGAQRVLELLQVEQAIADADLVLTCEGRFDSQTCFGKAPVAIARLAHQYGIACIGIAGELDDSSDCLYAEGFSALFSLCPGPASKQQAMQNAARYLSQTTEQVIRCRCT